ncbi:MAG: hypothetical protein ACT4PZ_17260 [Panacagrimonas sp.]
MKPFALLLLCLTSLTAYAHPGGHDDDQDDRPAEAQPAAKKDEATTKKPAKPASSHTHEHKKTETPESKKVEPQKLEDKKN